ncbi:alpha/beta-type small acid-soluble spore protein [Cohnella nanjingensis]|uniref:Alpha/beta-type small acid-soluble spore protein n=1 Tax=Cohnella nanjingensis TaxID=1387779 RepID=A0A7X0VE48_9BACL|nr:alpha/beta-type small acid-soluble spore protein [Cohnella nanjingensis]MBB6670630.1 alpha/beta-type small acid-soluble spore protein [Cohnella nanjingensis]
MARGNRNRKLVPECQKALDQMKYEIAAELGVPFGQGGAAGAGDTEFAGELGSFTAAGSGSHYLGDLTSREAGAVGGGITKRLVQQAQQTLL